VNEILKEIEGIIQQSTQCYSKVCSIEIRKSLSRRESTSSYQKISGNWLDLFFALLARIE